jgi:hypothetical protein
MHCGFTRRPPPRWPAIAGRLVVLACVFIALTLGLSAGPASARLCGPAGAPAKSSARTISGVRILAAHMPSAAKMECAPQQSWPERRGNADPMSFVFFLGIIVAFVLVPMVMGRREELPPE